jgi:uncharacterized protein YjbI with pentapeptide repeats
LDQALFTHADLRGANLSHIQAPGANFSHAQLDLADFTSAVLKGGKLHRVTETGTRWNQAVLTDVERTDQALAAAEDFKPGGSGGAPPSR